MKQLLLALLFLLVGNPATEKVSDWDFDAQLQAYFEAETARISQKTAKELANISDWDAFKTQARRELQEMFGLYPWPAKSPLKATITGTIDHEEFTVEKLHFQAMPGLYVTANLYIPKNLKEAAPAIIYVCGHATNIIDGYNLGAKTHYQHHPAWFARNGFVCLVLDTLQLAEIEGIHHGLYRYNRWWWLSRGYTPAGVEAWIGIRAIDYLETRQEVIKEKIGITGRSGGGANSWWIAALDDRITVAVPVAGITDLRDHVINGCVEGHCDCMYIFNYYKWDYAKIAALLAPRPLLLSNTDRDPIYPLEGVYRVYTQVRGVYEKLGVTDNFALNIAAGPHKDLQELRVHAFRWFNIHLKGDDGLIEKTAVKFFEPQQLRVFDELPKDEVNTRIDQQFVPIASAGEVVLDDKNTQEAEEMWMKSLKEKVFDFWPKAHDTQMIEWESMQAGSFTLTTYALKTDNWTTLPVFRIQGKKKKAKKAKVVVLDENTWSVWQRRLGAIFSSGEFWQLNPEARDFTNELNQELKENGNIYLVSMRGNGPAAFTGDERKQTHIRRRYFLLGQTLNSMQTWDILQGIHAISKVNSAPLLCSANNQTAVMLVYASLFADQKLKLALTDIPKSHDEGPQYPGIRRYMDIPEALMMAKERHEIIQE